MLVSRLEIGFQISFDPLMISSDNLIFLLNIVLLYLSFCASILYRYMQDPSGLVTSVFRFC